MFTNILINRAVSSKYLMELKFMIVKLEFGKHFSTRFILIYIPQYIDEISLTNSDHSFTSTASSSVPRSE